MTGSRTRAVLPLLAALLLVALPFAPAPRAQDAPLAPAEAEALARVEGYLNGITTMRADFLQVASTGEVARGTFYLKRPGRLRIEYEPSVPVLILADGHRLIYYDKELEQVNMVPIGRTLAAFLARPEIRFTGDVRVTGVAREKGVISVTVVRRAEPGEGSLTLVFDSEPLRLRLWTVTDAQGVQTRVALQDARFGVEIPPERFQIPDPAPTLRQR